MFSPDERKLRIALAIHLWKNWLQSTAPRSADNPCITEDVLDAANESLEMAKACGVKGEFLSLLLTVPVMKIEVEELEPWGVGDRPEKAKKRKHRLHNKSRPRGAT